MPELDEEIILDGDEGAPEGTGEEENQEISLSEVEQEAMSKGWSPEGVEGKPNLSAEEFIGRQPLYDKMHKTDRNMKRLEEQNKAITAHLEMMRKHQVEDKVGNLKVQKREALEEQNHDEVMRIDEEIIKVSNEEEIVVPEAAPTNDAFDNWLGQNQWYENNSEMQKYADRIGAGIHAQNPNANIKDIYEEVAEEVKIRFSDQFITKTQTSSVESGRPRGSVSTKGAKYSVKDLDSDTVGIMNNLIRSGVMTQEEYLADLETTGYFN